MSRADQRVEAFRHRQLRLPLHPLEKWVLTILSAHLCLMPWDLGTMLPIGQWVSLGLAAIGFALALLPRTYRDEYAGETPAYRVIPWIKLRRFPIFWLGLALLAYVSIQALNPGWLYVWTSKVWWSVPIRHLGWLPVGIEAPFARSNAWRALVIYGSVWLMTCTVWIGFLRRQSMRILLSVLPINALGLAVLLAAQRISGNHRIPWPLTEWTRFDLTSSFMNENHTGAYFALIAAGTLALATWYFYHGRRTLKKSSPGAVLGLGALFLGGAVFFTLSRGACLCLGLAALAYALWFYFWRRRQPSAGSNPAVTRIIAGAFVLFAAVMFHYLDFSEIYGRFSALAIRRENEPSVSARLMARAAAKTMLADHALYGVGAGCFRQLFPNYVKDYPEIYHGGTLYWEHAHDDWLEFPIELGIVGCLPLLAGAAWWAWFFIRRKAWWHPLAAPLLIGCGQALAHAWFDFPFQCPAILATWCVFLSLAGRWVEAESREA